MFPAGCVLSLKSVQLGELSVNIEDGGIFDRYRMQPDLDAIQKEFMIDDMSFFHGVTKTIHDQGALGSMPFPVFYYDMGMFTGVYSADIAALAALLPESELKPMMLWPGRGMIAFTSFQYRVSDVDTYNEVAISIVVDKPRATSLGPLGLLFNQLRRENWTYVWKLPVTTELACTGGQVGYNYPKYMARIDYEVGADADSCTLYDGDEMVVSFRGRHLKTKSQKMITNHGLAVKDGLVTDIPVLLNPRRMASSNAAADFTLELGKGEVADVIRGLKLGKFLRYEYIPSAQTQLCAAAK